LDAQKNQYAVGHFNTSNLEITKAIVDAAVSQKSPAIIGCSEKAIDYAGLEELIALVTASAQKANVPIALHLDHGKNLELIERCIVSGFSSVMIDCSDLDFSENIQKTQGVVALARRKGISVEAELGAIPGAGSNIAPTQKFFTDPDRAREFVEKTQIDSLAIAIGNSHGIPQPNEKLDFNLLSTIKQNVSIPLVLHGASETPVEDIKKAISFGICKINIDTEIRLNFTKALTDFVKANPQVWDPREILMAPKQTIYKMVCEKINLFGSQNRAPERQK
jgi:fructose-bisphosphate aldolase class II